MEDRVRRGSSIAFSGRINFSTRRLNLCKVLNKILINSRRPNNFWIMQNIERNSDFRQFLEDELNRRMQTLPRYSLRAFARQLDVDSSFLSKILSGKRTVTMRTIRMFGERLSLTPEELSRFDEISRERKMRRKIERLLEKMPSEDREHSTISLTVNEQKLDEARQRIKAFRKELAEMLSTSASTEGGKTYQISVTLFPLAQVSAPKSMDL